MNKIKNKLSKIFKKPIYVLGLPASGSTFTFQLLNEMFPGRVIKTHKFIPKSNCFKFVNYRDPRDIILSTAKRRYQDLGELAGIEASIIQSHINLFRENKYHNNLKKYKNDKKAYLIKYEDYFNGNEKKLIEFIAQKLNKNIKENKINYILDKYSLRSNLKRAKKLKTFNNYDNKSQIHGNHISNMGKSGEWKKVFSTKVINIIKKDIGKFIIDFGYEKNDNW